MIDGAIKSQQPQARLTHTTCDRVPVVRLVDSGCCFLRQVFNVDARVGTTANAVLRFAARVVRMIDVPAFKLKDHCDCSLKVRCHTKSVAPADRLDEPPLDATGAA